MGKLCFLQDLLEPSGLRSFHGRDLPTKEAQKQAQKTKEDLRPFLTILGTNQRARCLVVERLLGNAYEFGCSDY
jgi:hypothetical protein